VQVSPPPIRIKWVIKTIIGQQDRRAIARACDQYLPTFVLVLCCQVANDMNRSAMHRQMQSPSLARLAQSNLYASRTSNISSMSLSYRNNQSRGGPQQQSVDGTFDGLRDCNAPSP
jgi:hypothetical protein